MHIHSFLMLAEPYRVPWGSLIIDYVGFLAHFAIFGALAFHFLVLRKMRLHRVQVEGVESSFLSGITDAADLSASRIGFFGALLLLVNLLADAMATAGAKQITLFGAVQRAGPLFIAAVVFGVLFAVAFAGAIRRSQTAWSAAAVLGVVYAFRNIVTGKWTTLVNPLHEVAASLWLGTLFVMVAAGLPAILRAPLPGDRRGALVADLVARFSPVALGAAALLGVTGVTTAWRHLKYLSALWTTPYGYALDAKLAVVVIVVALGAWNWRRMSPRLGAEDAAHRLRRSAKAELAFAGIVLALTALLLSIPSPKLP